MAAATENPHYLSACLAKSSICNTFTHSKIIERGSLTGLWREMRKTETGCWSGQIGAARASNDTNVCIVPLRFRTATRNDQQDAGGGN
jgi:hypothetical protein